MSVRSEITTHFKQVAREHSKYLAPLKDDLALLDSGLDSLCFAIVIARLEAQLEVDPLSASEDAVFPVTFGEFVQFYENAALVGHGHRTDNPHEGFPRENRF